MADLDDFFAKKDKKKAKKPKFLTAEELVKNLEESSKREASLKNLKRSELNNGNGTSSMVTSGALSLLETPSAINVGSENLSTASTMAAESINSLTSTSLTTATSTNPITGDQNFLTSKYIEEEVCFILIYF